MEQTYRVLSGNIAGLQDRIATMNKRAKKLGVEPISLSVSSDPTGVFRQYSNFGSDNAVWIRDGECVSDTLMPTGRLRVFYGVTVNGEGPKLSGWRLMAVLEPLDAPNGAVNLVKEVPGEQCPAEYRDQIGLCTHCNTKRYRKETFVVAHDDGRTACVGRQCLQDFLGGQDPHRLAEWASLIFDVFASFDGCEDEEWGGGNYHCEHTYGMDTLLAWTCSEIDAHGWKSRKGCDVGDTATVDAVIYLIDGPGRHAPAHEWRAWEAEHERLRPTESQKEQAAAAIAWAFDLDPGEQNYLHNVKLLAQAGHVRAKHAGLAVSIMIAYRRHLGIVEERKKNAVSKHFGTIGKRGEYTLTLEDVRGFDTNWGENFLRRWRDPDGNVAVWWSSSSNHFEVGQTYHVRATVKDHDEYNGVAQTVLTRVSELK